MGYIYKITNLINNKIYIGQTINDVDLRFRQHLSAARNGSHLYLHQAIRKYGAENFQVEILETIANESLNNREIYYIKKYNSNNSIHGYNLDSGGGNGHIAHPNHSRYTRPVCKYDLQGNFIKRYESIVECAEDNNIYPSNVSACVQGKFTSWKEFQYKYAEDAPLIVNNKYGRRGVKQYDLDGNHIQDFNSISEAGKSIKAKSPYHISECCRGKVKTAYGYKWKWKDELCN